MFTRLWLTHAWIEPGNCERFIYFKEAVQLYLFTFFPTSDGVKQLQNFNSWWLTTIKKNPNVTWDCELYNIIEFLIKVEEKWAKRREATGLPWRLNSKESACSAGDRGNAGLIPGGDIPWRRKWQPTGVKQKIPWAAAHRLAESDRLSTAEPQQRCHEWSSVWSRDSTIRIKRRAGKQRCWRTLGLKDSVDNLNFLLTLHWSSGKHPSVIHKQSWIQEYFGGKGGQPHWTSLPQAWPAVRQTGARHFIPLFPRAPSSEMKFHARSNFRNIWFKHMPVSLSLSICSLSFLHLPDPFLK